MGRSLRPTLWLATTGLVLSVTVAGCGDGDPDAGPAPSDSWSGDRYADEPTLTSISTGGPDAAAFGTPAGSGE